MSRRNPTGRDINGVILLDKSTGKSSNTVLQEVKRLFDANKAGHTGSLDPLASGLLPICLGQATKVAQFLLDGDKQYYVRAKMGQSSTTGDSEGNIVDCGSTSAINKNVIKDSLINFIGDIEQIPPMYSALKRNGTPLYKLARKGIEVDRAARPVKIYDISFIDYADDIMTISVSCSKGTYIRTLVEDIGVNLGSSAYVVELRRTGFCHFDISQSLNYEQLVRLKEVGFENLDMVILNADEMLPTLQSIHLNEEQTNDIKLGRKISFSGFDSIKKLRLYDHNNQFIGIGESSLLSEILPKRLFV